MGNSPSFKLPTSEVQIAGPDPSTAPPPPPTPSFDEVKEPVARFRDGKVLSIHQRSPAQSLSSCHHPFVAYCLEWSIIFWCHSSKLEKGTDPTYLEKRKMTDKNVVTIKVSHFSVFQAKCLLICCSFELVVTCWSSSEVTSQGSYLVSQWLTLS